MEKGETERGRQQAQRRSPPAEERQRDAERSRQRLLDAALEEFALKGRAGARVGEIAARAGLNKQLITYYFGGKEGLYRAVQQLWLEREAEFASPELPLDELTVAYFRATRADPRLGRLLIWDGLTEAAMPGEESLKDEEREDLSDLQRRQAEGELAADLDPAMVQLASMAITVAPLAMPQIVRRLTGLDPESAEFERIYAEQIRRIIRYLRGCSHQATNQK